MQLLHYLITTIELQKYKIIKINDKFCLTSSGLAFELVITYPVDF